MRSRQNFVEAVNVVIGLLGMQPCAGTEVVPVNFRSHAWYRSISDHTHVFFRGNIGNVKVLVRFQFSLDSNREVAMKLVVRSDDDTVSDTILKLETYCVLIFPTGMSSFTQPRS